MAKKQPGLNRFNYRLQNFRNTFEIRNEVPKPEIKNGADDTTLWTDEYVAFVEKNFEHIFNQLYETEFVDYVFETYESRVGKEQFVQSILGNNL